MYLSDNEIIELVRGGTRHHYARLVDRYKDRAFTLALRMLRNREDAEEASQDAFIRAYNGLNRFEGKARFSTWFYRILYNVCLSRIRKRKDEYELLEYDDDNGYSGNLQSAGSNYIPDFETKDMMDFVKKTLSTLPSKYQTILSLFYLQELSHEEISDVTDLPIGTIKTHLFRARAMILERLQKELQIERAV